MAQKLLYEGRYQRMLDLRSVQKDREGEEFVLHFKETSLKKTRFFFFFFGSNVIMWQFFYYYLDPLLISLKKKN